VEDAGDGFVVHAELRLQPSGNSYLLRLAA
jgi:hypothetical protein